MKKGALLGLTVIFGLCLVGLALFGVSRTSAAMIEAATLGHTAQSSGWVVTPQSWEIDWVEEGGLYDGSERIALTIDEDGYPHYASGSQCTL